MSHLIIDSRNHVVAKGTEQALAEDFYASLTLGQTRLVDIDKADIATLANIAAADQPRLMAVGSGFLGAGTHPAQPYLEVMLGMHGVGDGTYDLGNVRYGYDDGVDIVRRFLDNAATWRGDTARTVKARLREIVAAA